MSNAPSLQMIRASLRRMVLLHTLRTLNAQGDYPTSTELVRESDPHRTVPRATMRARRAMVNEMRYAELITTIEIPSSRFSHLRITEDGISLCAGIFPERAK